MRFRVKGQTALPPLERGEEGRFRVIAGHRLQADAATHHVQVVAGMGAGIAGELALGFVHAQLEAFFHGSYLSNH